MISTTNEKTKKLEAWKAAGKRRAETNYVYIHSKRKTHSVIWEEDMSLSRHSIAIIGLFSTRSGNFCGDRPQW